MTEKEKPECPMERISCTKCSGFVKDQMFCAWGYKRTYPPPDESQKHVKRVEPRSRW